MKLLVLLAVLGAAAAADDQKAEDATFVSTYAAHPYPLAYTAGYPYNTYSAPAVYSSAYSPLAYRGLYNGAYHSYGAPVVHSLKKRDTAAAEEDQQADEATFYSTYAAHPYPLAYSSQYAASPVVYKSYGLQTPASTAPLAYSPLAYHGLYNGAYHSYAAPVVHSLKKRDTAAAEEDQQAEEATFVSTYAGHPLTYTAGYPYTAYNGGAGYHVPSVYSAAPVYSSYGLQTPASTAHLAYAGLPHAYHPYGY